EVRGEERAVATQGVEDVARPTRAGLVRRPVPSGGLEEPGQVLADGHRDRGGPRGRHPAAAGRLGYHLPVSDRAPAPGHGARPTPVVEPFVAIALHPPAEDAFPP